MLDGEFDIVDVGGYVLAFEVLAGGVRLERLRRLNRFPRYVSRFAVGVGSPCFFS